MSTDMQVELNRRGGRDGVRLLVIQPDANCDLDRMGAWLQSQDVVVEVVRPYRGEPVPAGCDHDGLIVLGGFLSSNDDASHPWLEDIRALIRAAVNADIPMLGICLGGQLLAQAFGGDVQRGAHGLEAGVITVSWTQQAAQNPVVANLPEVFRAVSFHQDAITRLPAGAVQLARSEKYTQQAFGYRSAVGVQFHPEITPGRLHRWVALTGEHQPEVVPYLLNRAKDFDREEAAVTSGTQQLAAQFLTTIRQQVSSVQS